MASIFQNVINALKRETQDEIKSVSKTLNKVGQTLASGVEKSPIGFGIRHTARTTPKIGQFFREYKSPLSFAQKKIADPFTQKAQEQQQEYQKMSRIGKFGTMAFDPRYTPLKMQKVGSGIKTMGADMLKGITGFSETLGTAALPYVPGSGGRAYREMQRQGQLTPERLEEISPSFKKTPTQIAGEAIDTALTVLPIPKELGALRGMQKSQMLKRGGIYGGAFGMTRAMMEGESPEEIARSTVTGIPIGMVAEVGLGSVIQRLFGAKKVTNGNLVNQFKKQVTELLAIDNPKTAKKIASLNLDDAITPNDLAGKVVTQLGKDADDPGVQAALKKWTDGMNWMMENTPEQYAAQFMDRPVNLPITKTSPETVQKLADVPKIEKQLALKLARLEKKMGKTRQRISSLEDLEAQRYLQKETDLVEGAADTAQILRGTKGMTADQIMQKYPDIQLKKEVSAKDIHGKKIKIPKGEELTPYELKGNKILLQDGETYIVNKNQYQNIKGQSITAEAKAKIRGEAPEIKTSGQLYEPSKKQMQMVSARQNAVAKQVSDIYKNTEAGARIQAEFDVAEAGRRQIMGYGADMEVKGISSTFPDWLPERTKTRPILNAVLKHLDEGTIPSEKQVNVRAAYDATVEKLLGDAKATVKTPSDKELAAKLLKEDRDLKNIGKRIGNYKKELQGFEKLQLNLKKNQRELARMKQTELADLDRALENAVTRAEEHKLLIRPRRIRKSEKMFKDIFRLSEKTFGDDYHIVEDAVFTPFDESKRGYVQDWENEITDLVKTIVKGLGIKKNSRASAAVQKYGEGLMTREQVIKKFGQKRAEDIFTAEKWFRKKYDGFIKEINAVEKMIYPNNPDKWTKARKDYFRHFQEKTDSMRGIINTFSHNAEIDPRLAGISEHTKPRTKWQSFKQQRKTDKTTYDAVGGFKEYVPAYSYAKNIDPNIPTLRRFVKLIEEKSISKDSVALNNYKMALEDWVNSIAGKSEALDRIVADKILGRKAFNLLNRAVARIKGNMIIANAGALLSQYANITAGLSEAGVRAPEVVGKTLLDIAMNKKPDTPFMMERLIPAKLEMQLERGVIKSPKRLGIWMLNKSDEIGARVAHNAGLANGKAKGLVGRELEHYADKTARKLVGGRGIGERSEFQRTRILGAAFPFQLEVTNLWHVLGERITKKEFGKIATLFLGIWLFNNFTEKMRGSRVVFDPIDAMLEAYKVYKEEEAIGTDRGMTAALVTGRLAGETLSNVPMGQTLAGLYPEYGFDTKVVPERFRGIAREQLFGDTDPTRFGTGPLNVFESAAKAPGYMAIMPFGGGQLKKTVGGLQAYGEGVSKTKTGRIRFPIEQDIPNLLKTAVFGQYAAKEAREYFDKGYSPASQTTVTARQFYDDMVEAGNRDAQQKVVDQYNSQRLLTKDVWKKYYDMIEDKRLSLTREEKKLKSMTSAERAEKIKENLSKLKTADERNAYMKNLMMKGLFSKSVQKEFYSQK